MGPEARLARGLQGILHRSATQREVQAFSRYLALLRQWNRVYSFTSYRDPARIVDRLFLDSMLFLPFVAAGAGRLLDLGSGAGIPGVPLKIVAPALSLTLIEARRKRTSFLATLVRELKLEGVQVLRGRAESLIEEFPSLEGGFDAVVSRAFGPLELVAPLALRFLRPGGRFVASGPPSGKPLAELTGLGSWHVVTSPVSGLSRRFFTIEKKLEPRREDL